MFIPSKRSSNLSCHICLNFVSKDKTLRLFIAFFPKKTGQCENADCRLTADYWLENNGTIIVTYSFAC